MSKLTPKYEELQSIYDISNEFYELFLARQWVIRAARPSATT